MKYLLILLILLSFLVISCSPAKRLEKFLNKHPELKANTTIIVRDTLSIPSIEADTAFIFKNSIDTFTLEKERLKLKIIHQNDTLRVNVISEGETKYVEKQIPVDKVVTQKKNIPEIYKISLIFCIFALLYGVYKLLKRFKIL